MLTKIKHWIFGLCATAGFVVIIGTAGASDIESITFNASIIQSVIGLGLIAIGFIGLKLSGWKYIG